MIMINLHNNYTTSHFKTKNHFPFVNSDVLINFHNLLRLGASLSYTFEYK